MYRIDETDYGFKFTFGNSIDRATMSRWSTAAMALVNSQTDAFSMMIDLRAIKPLSGDIEAQIQQVKDAARRKGMIRSVVVLGDALTTMYLRRAARRNGNYWFERYINANMEPNWDQVGQEWLVHGIDPDVVDVMALLSTKEKRKPASTA